MSDNGHYLATTYKTAKGAWDAVAGAGKDGKIPRANMQKFLVRFWGSSPDTRGSEAYWDTCDAWDSEQPGVTLD